MEPRGEKLYGFLGKSYSFFYSKYNWVLARVSGKDAAFFQAAVSTLQLCLWTGAGEVRTIPVLGFFQAQTGLL